MTALIKNNIDQLKNNITQLEKKYQRAPGAIKLLAVSKTKPVESIRQAYNAGQRAFGENYVQEAIEKIDNIKKIKSLLSLGSHTSTPLPLIEWHMIGNLQSNKAKQVAEYFDWVQTVNSIKLAEKLNQYRPESLANLNICIQINISDEPQKSGIKLGELDSLAQAINKLPRLTLRGLMAIGSANCPEKNNFFYEKLNKKFQDLKSNYASMDTLSLGMSQDMALAIKYGSTMVRVGRAIFGERER